MRKQQRILFRALHGVATPTFKRDWPNPFVAGKDLPTATRIPPLSGLKGLKKTWPPDRFPVATPHLGVICEEVPRRPRSREAAKDPNLRRTNWRPERMVPFERPKPVDFRFYMKPGTSDQTGQWGFGRSVWVSLKHSWGTRPDGCPTRQARETPTWMLNFNHIGK